MILETWFIAILLATLGVGILSFINKVIVEEKYDRNISIIVFFISILLAGLFLLFFENKTKLSWIIIVYGIFWGIFDYLLFKARFIALSGISSSLFFINYRLFSSLILLVIGIIIFGDTVTLYEYIGFFLGFVIFGLLFEKEKMKNIDYYTGIKYLGICILLIVLLHTGIKGVGLLINKGDLFIFNFATLLIAYSITGGILTYFVNQKNISIKIPNLKKIVLLNIVHGIIWVLYIFYLMKSYSLADLGVVYKIQSYSLFIPIILSIIFYHEKLTPKKIIAFILTMISLWFFI